VAVSLRITTELGGICRITFWSALFSCHYKHWWSVCFPMNRNKWHTPDSDCWQYGAGFSLQSATHRWRERGAYARTLHVRQSRAV